MVVETSPFGAECPVRYLWGKMQQSAPAGSLCRYRVLYIGGGGWVADAQRNHAVIKKVYADTMPMLPNIILKVHTAIGIVAGWSYYHFACWQNTVDTH